jgi:hypothetical protein
LDKVGSQIKFKKFEEDFKKHEKHKKRMAINNPERIK